MAVFLTNNSKMYSRRPNTMKETLYWAGILENLLHVLIGSLQGNFKMFPMWSFSIELRLFWPV